MLSVSGITANELMNLVGLPQVPAIVDVRDPADLQADACSLPAAMVRDAATVAEWAGSYRGRDVVAICRRGGKISQSAAAWLRHEGVRAAALDGGLEAWREVGGPLVDTGRLPPRDAAGRTVWVTRARPKVDRVACPWLIRRFVDPQAVFLYVPPGDVPAVAERFGATPFDVDGVFWSHRGENCTFDTMLAEFGLVTPALLRFAAIVRGADTARPDLTPQAAGFLAACLGLSRMYDDDLAQLDASMLLCDASYRWCRDAVAEGHNWPGTVKAA